jgi:hypothetical protein
MTQQEIDNTIVDVIYNDKEIKHVLAPNTEGVRGVPVGQNMLRESLKRVKGILGYYGYDLAKINEYQQELINQNQNQ